MYSQESDRKMNLRNDIDARFSWAVPRFKNWKDVPLIAISNNDLPKKIASEVVLPHLMILLTSITVENYKLSGDVEKHMEKHLVSNKFDKEV